MRRWRWVAVSSLASLINYTLSLRSPGPVNVGEKSGRCSNLLLSSFWIVIFVFNVLSTSEPQVPIGWVGILMFMRTGPCHYRPSNEMAVIQMSHSISVTGLFFCCLSGWRQINIHHYPQVEFFWEQLLWVTDTLHSISLVKKKKGSFEGFSCVSVDANG